MFPCIPKIEASSCEVDDVAGMSVINDDEMEAWPVECADDSGVLSILFCTGSELERSSKIFLWIRGHSTSAHMHDLHQTGVGPHTRTLRRDTTY